MSRVSGRGARHAETDVTIRPRFGRARLSALHRGTRQLACADRLSSSHASWDAGRAGVTRPRLSQSRDCTSRTGRSTGVNDAQSRPGTVCETARGNRTCSTF